MYNLESFKSDCYAFNSIAGNDKLLNREHLLNQFKLIEEEVQETKEGFQSNDVVEVLDGIIDTLVVTLGMLQKLEAMGIDVTKAMKDTAQNNLSKFVDNTHQSSTWSNITVNKYLEEGIHVTPSYNQEYNVWVFKDTNGKIRKPQGYKANDVSGSIPEKLIKEGF